MALITTAAREQLIALFAAMFRAAPGANNLSAMVAAYEGGATTAQIAASLATRVEFQSVYPTLQTAEEFADSLVDTMLPASTPTAAIGWATNWVVTNLAAGKTRAQIITEAVVAIRATANTNYADAKEQLANRVEVATYYSVTQLQSGTSLSALQNVIANVTASDATVTSAKTAVDTGVLDANGITYALSESVDNISGGAGNDVINGVIDATNGSSFSTLDTVNGGSGTDSLKISAITDFVAAAGATITNVESVTIAAAAKVGTFTASGTGALDLSTIFSGITSLTVGGSTGLDINAPSTAAVTVTGAVGGVEVVGGTTQTVALSTQAAALQLSKATGAVSVTSSAQGANTIVIDDGTSVTVNNGMSAVGATTQGAVTIGGTTAPSGAVAVTNTVANAASVTSAGSAITVTGGTTVSVVQTAAQAIAVAAGANTTLAQGKVVINGTSAITSATVSQSATATAAATVVGVTGVTEINTLTFKALLATETQIINGLTFTAGAAGTTAEETAFAFANLASGVSQGYSTKGTYSGTWTASTFASGANSGANLVFTGTSAGVRTNLADTGTGADPTVVETTAGVTAVTAAGKGGVTQGVVEIDDTGATADTLTTVSVTGYATGSFVKSDALTTLTLASNTASSSMAVHNATTTTLGLTVNGLGTGSTVNLDAGGATYTTLNLSVAGTSTAAITAASVKSLTVDGSKVATLTSSVFTALETLTVTGSAGVTVVASGASVKTVNTTGTTGTNTITIDATVAKYTGGAGVDAVTTSAAAPSKAVSLGGDNDSLTLATGTTTATGVLTGGDGSDTLAMAMADAVTASATATFSSSFEGFEKLKINGVAAGAAGTVNVANMDSINYVISNAVGTVAAVKEVLKVTLAGAPINTDTFIFDGVTFTYSDVSPTLAEFITGIAGTAFTTWDVTASDATSVTFTNKTAAAVTDAVSGDFTGTYAGTKTPSITTQSVTAVTASGLLTIDNLASAGTLELASAGAGATVLVKDAATGTADSLNIVLTSGTALTAGTVTAANIESIVLTSTDSDTVVTPTVHVNSLTLTADKATSFTATGNTGLTLTGSTALTTINGWALTGAFTVTSLNTTAATTITGGAGNDVLGAATGTTADVLTGGAGNDTLTANAGLNVLTGGAGTDTFKIMTSTANANSYATITDATKGDYVQFAVVGTPVFKQTQISLGETAVFQDFANAAVYNLAQGEIGWFAYAGNTYIVQDAGGTTATFTNSDDIIVKLTGVVDLSTASFDTTDVSIRIG